MVPNQVELNFMLWYNFYYKFEETAYLFYGKINKYND